MAPLPEELAGGLLVRDLGEAVFPALPTAPCPLGASWVHLFKLRTLCVPTHWLGSFGYFSQIGIQFFRGNFGLNLFEPTDSVFCTCFPPGIQHFQSDAPSRSDVFHATMNGSQVLKRHWPFALVFCSPIAICHPRAEKGLKIFRPNPVTFAQADGWQPSGSDVTPNRVYVDAKTLGNFLGG